MVMGGHRTDPASNVLQPTVLTEIHPNSSVLIEETFGPVLPIVRVRDVEEAIERTNGLAYGLSASVWTTEPGQGCLHRSTPSGRCGLRERRGGTFRRARPPIRGRGGERVRRSHGLDGLREMTRTRSVLVDRLNLEREPWWFPYSRRTERLPTGYGPLPLEGGSQRPLRSGHAPVNREEKTMRARGGIG